MSRSEGNLTTRYCILSHQSYQVTLCALHAPGRSHRKSWNQVKSPDRPSSHWPNTGIILQSYTRLPLMSPLTLTVFTPTQLTITFCIYSYTNSISHITPHSIALTLLFENVNYIYIYVYISFLDHRCFLFFCFFLNIKDLLILDFKMSWFRKVLDS